MSQVPSPQSQMSRLIDGYLITQLLYVAAKLGIADLLANGPLPSDAIARAVGANSGSLHRVLRGLAAEGVFSEDADGRFGLTELGACLREGVPGSMRGTTLVRGGLYFRAAAVFLDAVRTGATPFDLVYGETFFTHLDRNPDLAAAFQSAMSDRSHLEAAAVVASYRFDAFHRLVDVGGGSGVLLEAILSATPGLHAVLLDRPGAAEQATARFAASDLADRSECIAGDFFTAVPPGCDAYLLSRIIHDWNDESSHQILTRCREAMADTATLLLVEAVLPTRAHDAPAAIRMDLHMLTLLTGRERTAAEYERLLAGAGFRLIRIVPTDSPNGVAIIEAIPNTNREMHL